MRDLALTLFCLSVVFPVLQGFVIVLSVGETNKAKAHAEELYPRESVGLVVAGEYVPVENVATNPEEQFRIPRKTIAHYGSDIEAIIHSHPDGSYYPSEADMQGQVASGVAWGIVHVSKGVARDPFYWGGDTPMPPLKGRVFQHGVTDCYALIRDYFRVNKGVQLDEFPREWEWWLAPGYDLYQENFQSQKFDIIHESEVQEGDCFLAQIRSKVINHAGVYVGGGLILHQLGCRDGYSESYPSCEQPLAMWQKFIRHWVRYRG